MVSRFSGSIPGCWLWISSAQARPRSADRTRSPAAVSRKREYFKYPPETIGDFAPGDPNSGTRRPISDSQKPAIGGPLWHCRGQSLRAPECGWLGREDSNLRMVESKSTALPLGDAPIDGPESSGTGLAPADSLRPRRSIEGVEPFQQARPANSPGIEPGISARRIEVILHANRPPLARQGMAPLSCKAKISP